MKGNNFGQQVRAFVCISNAAVNNTTVDGSAINEPWKIGHQMALIASAAIPGASTLTIKLQGKKRSDGTWVDIVDKAASPATVKFTQAKIDDGGQVDGGVLLGTVPLDKLDSTTYSDLRVRAINGTASAVVLTVIALIVDLYSHPGSEVDDLAGFSY